MFDGRPASVGNGSHVGFFADSKARKFDITPQDPQYEVLEGLAQEFVR